MMAIAALPRRLMVISAALGTSALLLHAQLADALTTRGDELLSAGLRARAVEKYSLAVRLSPNSNVPAERLLTASLLSGDGRSIEDALRTVQPAIHAHHDALELRQDYALCLQRAGRVAAAADTFEDVGRRAHDPRSLMFAALDARTMHQQRRARKLLKLALTYDPGFRPAARALRRLSE